MILHLIKRFWIIIFILTLTSCSNIEIVKINQDIKRIDKFNSNGEIVKSYFKKFDKETNQWLLVDCIYDTKTKVLKSNECEFTDISLHMIRIAKENDNNTNSSISENKNVNTEQEEQNQDQQENNEEEEEEGFFDWCEEDCEE